MNKCAIKKSPFFSLDIRKNLNLNLNLFPSLCKFSRECTIQKMTNFTIQTFTSSPSPFFGSLAFSPRKWWNPNRSERAIEPPRGVFGIVPRHQSTLSRRLLSLKYVRRGWKRADDIHTRCQRRARDGVAFSRVVNGDGVKREGRKGAKGTGAKGESVSCCTSRYGELAKRLQRQAFRRLRWCSNSSM